MEQFFDDDLFLMWVRPLLEKNELTTEYISAFLSCTNRYVQKWAISNGVDFISKGGRKYYIWTEAKIREFADYHNRPPKPKKRYYIPKYEVQDIVNSVLPKLSAEFPDANKSTVESGLKAVIARTYEKNPTVTVWLIKSIFRVKWERLKERVKEEINNTEMIISDTDISLKPPSKSNELTTKHIAESLNCTTRHVQKWARNNGVDYIYKEGRKYYVWDETKRREFTGYYHRKYSKHEKKKYYIPKWRSLEAVKSKLNLEKEEELKLRIKLLDKKYNLPCYYYYRDSIDSIIRAAIRKLFRTYKWLTDEYLLQEITNENPKLLRFFQTYIDNPNSRVSHIPYEALIIDWQLLTGKVFSDKPEPEPPDNKWADAIGAIKPKLSVRKKPDYVVNMVIEGYLNELYELNQNFTLEEITHKIGIKKKYIKAIQKRINKFHVTDFLRSLRRY